MPSSVVCLVCLLFYLQNSVVDIIPVCVLWVAGRLRGGVGAIKVSFVGPVQRTRCTLSLILSVSICTAIINVIV